MGAVTSVAAPYAWMGEEMLTWGSFVLQGIPAIGLLLAGRYRSVGWLICLNGQTFAVVYGWETEQWGLVWAAPVFAGIYLWNWRKWRAERRNNGSSLPEARRCCGGVDQTAP